MKIVIIFIFLLFVSGCLIAQNNLVNINFDIDGKSTVYKNAFVDFVFNKDTIRVNVDGLKLKIPEYVFRKKVTIIFSVDKFFLRFDSIPITLNTYSPQWTIGIDKKPFDKKKHWQVKSWKKVQIVYYLHNDDGRTFTVWLHKKSSVIKQ
jgi:hypothetical protein